LKNQNFNIESKYFQRLLLEFWKQDDFRKKTYDQLSKDFGLCEIDLPISEREKCTTQEELNDKIGQQVSQVNIQRLLYIIDLKETLNNDNKSLTETMVIRVAYKVYLRTFFVSKYPG
tara:strand:- start:1451 stop:1801 length:351 start_codon:yes stop_codon:yes gene_type:complete